MKDFNDLINRQPAAIQPAWRHIERMANDSPLIYAAIKAWQNSCITDGDFAVLLAEALAAQNKTLMDIALRQAQLTIPSIVVQVPSQPADECTLPKPGDPWPQPNTFPPGEWGQRIAAADHMRVSQHIGNGPHPAMLYPNNYEAIFGHKIDEELQDGE
jgi:hypothetical protein